MTLTAVESWLGYADRGRYTKAQAKAELLNAAADLILVDGWTKGAFIDADGCLCIEGALAVAAGVDVIDEEDFNDESDPKLELIEDCISDVAQHVREQDPDSIASSGTVYQDLTDWNDTPERELFEVEAALRGTAAAVTQ